MEYLLTLVDTFQSSEKYCNSWCKSLDSSPALVLLIKVLLLLSCHKS